MKLLQRAIAIFCIFAAGIILTAEICGARVTQAELDRIGEVTQSVMPPAFRNAKITWVYVVVEHYSMGAGVQCEPVNSKPVCTITMDANVDKFAQTEDGRIGFLTGAVGHEKGHILFMIVGNKDNGKRNVKTEIWADAFGIIVMQKLGLDPREYIIGLANASASVGGLDELNTRIEYAIKRIGR